MFTRYKIWQDPIIESQVQEGWQNTIVLGFPTSDMRLRLRGYGWKPSSEDSNLTVLYQGRYAVYYRKRFDLNWTYFVTLNSERASYDDSNVYKDVFVAFGELPDNVYEIKIVAMDGAMFSSWTGTIEGIEYGDQFWYDLFVKAGRPLKINATDEVSFLDFGFAGRSILDVDVLDDISIALEDLFFDYLHFINVYEETIGVEEYFTANIAIVLSVFDTPSTEDAFSTEVDWVNLGTPKEDISVIQDVVMYPYPMGITPQELVTVTEVLGFQFTLFGLSVNDNVSIHEDIEGSVAPPWPVFARHYVYVQEDVQVAVSTEMFYEPCTSTGAWINESTGTGFVNVPYGEEYFAVSTDGASNVGARKRNTGINFGKFYSLQFRFQNMIPYQQYSGNNLLFSIGSEKRTLNIAITPLSDYYGTVELINGTTFYDVPLGRYAWNILRFDVLEECIFGEMYGCLVEFYINDAYVGQGFAGYDSSNLLSNGQIRIKGRPVGSYSFLCGIDEIYVSLLTITGRKDLWRRDKIDTKDISVTEYVAGTIVPATDIPLVVNDNVHVDEVFGGMDNINIEVHEGITPQEIWANCNLTPLFVNVYESFAPTDYAVYQTRIDLVAIDNVSTGEYVEIVNLTIPLSIAENMTVVEYIMMNDIVVEMAGSDDVTVQENLSVLKFEITDFAVQDGFAIEEYLEFYQYYLPWDINVNDIATSGEDVWVTKYPIINLPSSVENISCPDALEVLMPELNIMNTSVALLFHFDGNNGDTSGNDDGAFKLQWSSSGNCKIDQSEKVFGNASLHNDGTVGYAQIASHVAFNNMGDSDWFIEARMKTASLDSAKQAGIFVLRQSSNNNWRLGIYNTGSYYQFRFTIVEGGSTKGNCNATITYTNNVWHTVAVSRRGSNIYFFFDGALIDTYTTAPASFIANSGALKIGTMTYLNSVPFASECIDGWIDEFIWMKGVAYQTVAYTVPTEPYAVDNILLQGISMEENITVTRI